MSKVFDVKGLALKAREAARVLAGVSAPRKNKALKHMAQALRARARPILEVNQIEVQEAHRSEKTEAFVDRLSLDEGRLKAIALSLERVAELPDPVGQTTHFSTRPNGLQIRKMRIPLGVIAVIYESRPGVTADAAGLCLKSGNAVLLRGGREALKTSQAIAEALQAGLRSAEIPPGAIGFVRDSDRAAVRRLLSLDGLIDLVIPRGGPNLTGMVRRNSRIPVLAHEKGLCHTYVDASADLNVAEEICFNAKVERPGVCNAMETLLVHQAIARKFLPPLVKRYQGAGVEIRGCQKTRAILPHIKRAKEADWDTEYLDLILSVRIVRSYKEAVDHIAIHGSGLAEAIVTSDPSLGESFLREVDAGAVYVNASTRFTDGGEFGMGAEMGISTQKLHARGPVGLVGLTCEKYIITGTGQVRDSRSGRGCPQDR